MQDHEPQSHGYSRARFSFLRAFSLWNDNIMTRYKCYDRRQRRHLDILGVRLMIKMRMINTRMILTRVFIVVLGDLPLCIHIFLYICVYIYSGCHLWICFPLILEPIQVAYTVHLLLKFVHIAHFHVCEQKPCL